MPVTIWKDLKLEYLTQSLITDRIPNHGWLKQLIIYNGTFHTHSIPLKQLIPFTLWHIWNIHNKNNFENVQLKPYIKTILQLTTKHLFKQTLTHINDLK